MAVNRRRKVEGQPEADFFNVSAWGKQGENCAKYLEKGRKVAVTGQVSVRTYEGNDGVTRASMEVFAEDVEFVSNREQSANASTPPPAAEFTPVDDDENLPF